MNQGFKSIIKGSLCFGLSLIVVFLILGGSMQKGGVLPWGIIFFIGGFFAGFTFEWKRNSFRKPLLSGLGFGLGYIPGFHLLINSIDHPLILKSFLWGGFLWGLGMGLIGFCGTVFRWFTKEKINTTYLHWLLKGVTPFLIIGVIMGLLVYGLMGIFKATILLPGFFLVFLISGGWFGYSQRKSEE